MFIKISLFACLFRPTQYGPDVVGILSKLFNSFEEGSLGTSPEVAETAIYLGLEALKSLCEAEVVSRFISISFSVYVFHSRSQIERIVIGSGHTTANETQ